MKKYLFVLFALFCAGSSVKAAVGDTTWVQATNTQFTHYGNFDTAITFPSGTTTYRRIYMIFTLGKYTCPGTPTYCGDWDYTVLNYLFTPGGDSLELGRLITPYANAGAPRTPWTWTQRYIYDVTDYASKLQGAATIRVAYSGYSWGFNGNIKFAFIEGTPDRDVKDVKRLWWGSYGYGDTTHHDSNNINVHFPQKDLTAPNGTETTDLKFLVTGHGSDALGCCEFASHNYDVKLNGSTVATKAIWRDNCGSNELYPQSGTWLYERANWCPGAMVYPNFHTLPGVTAGTAFNTAIAFEPYVGGGSYTTEAHIIYYGPMNKTKDVTVEDIVAPTDNENYYRENPTSSAPVIRVKNTGSTQLTSILFESVVDGQSQLYGWSGTLDPLEATDITFPYVWAIVEAGNTPGVHDYRVNVLKVNGEDGDDDASNNTMSSTFTAAPVWPVTFKVVLRTNNEASGGVSETSWKIYDIESNVVYSRVGGAINTTFTDTVVLSPGAYRFEVTDGGCDGLQWWANSGSGINNGFISVRPMVGSAAIPMKGYYYTGTYNNDFGCTFTQYFTTNWPTAVEDVDKTNVGVQVYPVPAGNVLNIDINGLAQVSGTVKLIDVTGRTVLSQTCTADHIEVNTSALTNGTYMVIFENQAAGIKSQARAVIVR